MKTKRAKRECENCYKDFVPASGTQKYCGSRDKRKGCAWKVYKNR